MEKADRNALDELSKERDAYAQALSAANAAFREKVKELSIIKRISESMLWNLDKRRICTEIVNVIIDETMIENCSLWLVDREGAELEIKAVRGQEDENARYFATGEPGMSRLPLGKGVAGWVAANGQSLLIKDVTKSKRFLKSESRMTPPIKSLLCLPIMGEEAVIGVINMSHPDIGAISKENERSLSIISDQAALAFSNLLLFENTKSFSERLEILVEERTRDLSFSENKYRSFMEQAGDAIVVMERGSGKILEVNHQLCEYTGFRKEDLIGEHIDLVAGDCLKRELSSAPDAGGVRLHDRPLKRRTGPHMHVDIAGNVISTVKGDVVHLIIRDITHRREMEERLKDYSERLEELVDQRTRELEQAQAELVLASKLAAVGEMASGVAHEINNPIAIISGYAEDLAGRIEGEGLDSQERVKEALGALSIISRQAERCQEITHSLLGLTRVSDMNVTQVDVNKIVSQSIDFARQRRKSEGITFEVVLAPGLPRIMSDPSMIEQVLINVLNNAVDATEVPGQITVTTNFDGSNARISVSDNGEGMPNDVIKKIFDPFFTTKAVGEGTGLGLSICHRLVERLRGAVSVISEPGIGTEFVITLPENFD